MASPNPKKMSAATSDRSESPATRAYRITKSFAAVHFDQTGKGLIVFLPKGAELSVIGGSRIGECFEVLWEDRVYNMFKVDLLGSWSTPILPIRAAAAQACA